MKITLLCSSEQHPVNGYLLRWMETRTSSHEISLVRTKKEASGGDIMFLISCSEIITAEDRSAYRKSLVIHASDLPTGRGWSPHIWQILQGKTDVTVTLLEAADKVDSGDIWHQLKCNIPQDALWDEINDRIFNAELALMDYALDHFEDVEPRPQRQDVQATYYPKRAPQDSELDPKKSLEEQFDLIRVSDPDRFPAFFRMHGHIYQIKLEKKDK